MNKEDFFNKNDEKFLPMFDKDYEDPMFHYSKILVDDEIAVELNDEGEVVPSLLYGNTGLNSGFCIYTGSHFIWLNAESPEEAIAISKRIIAFEEV